MKKYAPVIWAFTLLAIGFAALALVASNWTSMRDAQFSERLSQDHLRITSEKLIRLYGQPRNLTPRELLEIAKKEAADAERKRIAP